MNDDGEASATWNIAVADETPVSSIDAISTVRCGSVRAR